MERNRQGRNEKALNRTRVHIKKQPDIRLFFCISVVAARLYALGYVTVGRFASGVGTLRFAACGCGRLSEMALSRLGGAFSACRFPAGFASGRCMRGPDGRFQSRDDIDRNGLFDEAFDAADMDAVFGTDQ